MDYRRQRYHSTGRKGGLDGNRTEKGQNYMAAYDDTTRHP